MPTSRGSTRIFLRRHFASAAGNLYEGTLSDFDPAWMGTFELKTNELANDRRDLQAVADALTVPDAQLVARLDPLINLEEFFDYWAMESLVRQWDGYAGNTNNFFLYHDPTSGRFWFLPWGIDGIMDPAPPDAANSRPLAVMTKGLLVRRLYNVPSTRTRYLGRLRALLDSVFKESEMLAEIDRMQPLITPYVPAADAAAFRAELDRVRAFVRGRRQVLLAELAAPPAATAAPAAPPCLDTIGTISGSFSTTWNTLSAIDPVRGGPRQPERHRQRRADADRSGRRDGGPGHQRRGRPARRGQRHRAPGERDLRGRHHPARPGHLRAERDAAFRSGLDAGRAARFRGTGTGHYRPDGQGLRVVHLGRLDGRGRGDRHLHGRSRHLARSDELAFRATCRPAYRGSILRAWSLLA